jgi:hypothetical protein
LQDHNIKGVFVDSQTVYSLFNKIVAVLKEHNMVLINHRQNIESLYVEMAQLKERLEKLKTSISDKPDDNTISLEE